MLPVLNIFDCCLWKYASSVSTHASIVLGRSRSCSHRCPVSFIIYVGNVKGRFAWEVWEWWWHTHAHTPRFVRSLTCITCLKSACIVTSIYNSYNCIWKYIGQNSVLMLVFLLSGARLGLGSMYLSYMGTYQPFFVTQKFASMFTSPVDYVLYDHFTRCSDTWSDDKKQYCESFAIKARMKM